MANSKTSVDFRKYATVDSTPSASGFVTDSVDFRGEDEDCISFFITGTGTMIVTLQFRNAAVSSSWTDFASFGDNERFRLKGGSVGEQWRAIVKNGDYTSGSKTFGFDW